MEKKYKLTEETIIHDGRTLYRIEAVKDFINVKCGDKGGYIEKESNLSHYGNAWVWDDAKVFGDAWVYDNVLVFGNAKVYDKAWVFGNARVSGNSRVCGDAWVYGNAKVYGNACVFGNACVCGDAEIKEISDYIVFKNWWSSGRYFTWTRSNNMWKVGCFYGTGKELIKKAYKDSEMSGRNYEVIVKLVEQNEINT